MSTPFSSSDNGRFTSQAQLQSYSSQPVANSVNQYRGWRLLSVPPRNQTSSVHAGRNFSSHESIAMQGPITWPTAEKYEPRLQLLTLPDTMKQHQWRTLPFLHLPSNAVAQETRVGNLSSGPRALLLPPELVMGRQAKQRGLVTDATGIPVFLHVPEPEAKPFFAPLERPQQALPFLQLQIPTKPSPFAPVKAVPKRDASTTTVRDFGTQRDPFSHAFTTTTEMDEIIDQLDLDYGYLVKPGLVARMFRSSSERRSYTSAGRLRSANSASDLHLPQSAPQSAESHRVEKLPKEANKSADDETALEEKDLLSPASKNSSADSPQRLQAAREWESEVVESISFERMLQSRFSNDSSSLVNSIHRETTLPVDRINRSWRSSEILANSLHETEKRDLERDEVTALRKQLDARLRSQRLRASSTVTLTKNFPVAPLRRSRSPVTTMSTLSRLKAERNAFLRKQKELLLRTSVRSGMHSGVASSRANPSSGRSASVSSVFVDFQLPRSRKSAGGATLLSNEDAVSTRSFGSSRSIGSETIRQYLRGDAETYRLLGITQSFDRDYRTSKIRTSASYR